MAQSVVVGAGYSLSGAQRVGGGLNAHAMGDEINMNLTGDGSVTVSLMFLINGEKTYETVTVSGDNFSKKMPEGTTYVEFNIQSATEGAEYFRMEILQNS